MTEKQVVCMDRDTFEGVKDITDALGQEWQLRAIPLRREKSLTCWLIGKMDNVGYLTTLLYNPNPGPWTLLRRLIRLTDYSYRYVRNHFPMMSFESIREDAFKLSTGMTEAQFEKKQDEAQKKRNKVIKAELITMREMAEAAGSQLVSSSGIDSKSPGTGS